MRVLLPRVSSAKEGLTVCGFCCLELARLKKVYNVRVLLPRVSSAKEGLQCAGFVASS